MGGGGEEGRRREDLDHAAWILRTSGVADPDAVARKLLEEFGSLSRIVAGTSGRRLLRLDPGGSASAAVASFRNAMLRVLGSGLDDRAILRTRPALYRYLTAATAFDAVERLRALNLDAGGRLISDDVVAEGSVDRVSVRPRQILRRTLEVEAASLVLVHNHPGGATGPSEADVAYTAELREAAEAVDVRLVDHLVVSSAGVFSFAQAGLLR